MTTPSRAPSKVHTEHDTMTSPTMTALRGGALAALAALLLVLAPLGAATASTPPNAAEPEVTFKVTIVHASNQGEQVDDSLRRFAGYFGRSFKRFTRFAQLSSEQATVRRGGNETFKVPDGTQLKLRYEDLRNNFVRVGLELGGLTTTINVKDGGLFFQAGRGFKGGTLVLAIEVRSER